MIVKEYDDNNVVIKDVECTRDTPKAVLVVIEGTEHWIPQRQIHADSEVWICGDSGRLIMSKWIAVQRGLWESEED